MDIWQGCPSKSYNQCWSGNMPIQNNLRYFGDAKETESFTQFTRLCLALWRQSEQLFRNETASATRQNPKFLYSGNWCTDVHIQGWPKGVTPGQETASSWVLAGIVFTQSYLGCHLNANIYGTQIWYLDQIFFKLMQITNGS